MSHYFLNKTLNKNNMISMNNIVLFDMRSTDTRHTSTTGTVSKKNDNFRNDLIAQPKKFTDSVRLCNQLFLFRYHNRKLITRHRTP